MDKRAVVDRFRDRRIQAAIGGGTALLIVVILVVLAVTGGPTSTVTAGDEFVDVHCDGDGARGLVRNDTDTSIVVGVDVAFVNDEGDLLHRGGRTGIDVGPKTTAGWSVDYNPRFAPERIRGDHPSCIVTLAENASG